MPTFLLTWNPAKWHWPDMRASVQRCQSDGYVERRWSCGRSKQIQPGDRIFLLRQGQEPRGLIASGAATSSFFEDKHWSEEDSAHPSIARYVDVRFDVLLDPDREPIFLREWLDVEHLAGDYWNTQVSGIRIPEHIAQELEQDWARFLASRNIIQDSTVAHHASIAEESQNLQYIEGAVQTVVVNRYERNIAARRACIRHFGFNCDVCGFNFAQTYGDIGIGFIHVHHLKPLADIGEQYTLDPIKDLRPVCANCHAMLHHSTPPLTIEALRRMLNT